MVPATDLAGAAGGYVLLAPGGAGKSTILHELRDLEGGVAVDLVGLDRGEIEPAVAAAVATSRPVYLDSLDEADAFEPAMFRRLQRAMQRPEAAGVSWRLACRPAAWNDFGMPDLATYRLLPLSRDAATEWLTAAGVDEGFLDALGRAGSARLTGSALHFVAAAQRWQQLGHLPARQADILENEIVRLLAEREDGRESLRVPADLRRRAAGRLAAFSVFSGVTRFTLRGTPTGADVSLGDLPSTAEPDRPDHTFGHEIHKEVLGSALFESGAPGSVVFRHQVYTDYLAAAYVAGREPTSRQLTEVLSMTDGVLPRAMRSVAAWVAALRPQAVDLLAPKNVGALLASGVEFPAPVRAALVGALLHAAREARLAPVWSVDLSLLDHPDLSRQLTAHAAEHSVAELESWWICRIALACRVTEMLPFATRVAGEREWFAWARRPAITLILKLGTDSDRQALRSRLDLTEKADPDDELRAAFIDGMFPRHLPLAEILPMLHAPRTNNYIGAYKKLLGEFPDRVAPSDLPMLLSWATQRTEDDRFQFAYWVNEFLTTAVTRAFDHLHEPGQLEALSSLLAEAPLGQRFDPPWTGDRRRRRELAVAVAERCEGRWWELLRSGLVTPEDAAWLTDDAGTFPAAARAALDRCLAKINEPPGDPAVPEERPESRRIRESLVAARQDLLGWWRTVIALSGESSPEMWSFDLTARPGWSLLTAEEQREVIDLGWQYVIRHRPDPETWLDSAAVSRDAYRDWAGVYLLTTVAEHHPERLAGLPGACWSTWAPVIGGVHPYYEGEPLKKLIALMPGDPREQVLTTVRRVMDARPGWWRTPVQEYFAQDLAPTLVGYLRHRRFDDTTSADILGFLLEFTPAEVAGLCRSLASDDDSPLARRARRHLAETEPQKVAEAVLAGDADRAVVEKRIAGLHLSELDTHTLGDLTRFLFDRFPPADDPPFEKSFDHPGVQARKGALQVLMERGEARTLERLAEGRTAFEIRYLRHFSESAQAIAADTRMARLTPEHLLVVLGRSDVRLVQDARDLLDAVIDHLVELQHELTHRNAFRDLWSRDLTDIGSEDDISDWVQRHLEKRLNGGTIDREVQVQRRSASGIGTRMDLTVSARSATATVDTARVVIEAKLVNNPEIETATRNQLIDRYLTAMGLRHGLLLVYWVRPDQRPARWRERTPAHPAAAGLLAELERQASEAPAGYDVRPFVLDVSRPVQAKETAGGGPAQRR
ncbi:hypothetical protein BJY16_004534 [Actinoplanes octamycinicus]|uniref:Uncharacterized protein n=1 Tax=Actinoplanes octamycinicus TaxID=135948 RepID=A0A7W7M8R7_9ACTN|nr:hypothetical protein [Actinoplanes octamycinicus]MBB4741075.1 hypothetical protein [Actinoplanes octamycinicus]GIE55980.1 hypothetical protein Aoc01nite_13820 [Actinoplanes octamycinicus]